MINIIAYEDVKEQFIFDLLDNDPTLSLEEAYSVWETNKVKLINILHVEFWDIYNSIMYEFFSEIEGN